MGEPGGLPSMGSHRDGHDWSDLAAAATLILCLFFLNNHLFQVRNLKRAWDTEIT